MRRRLGADRLELTGAGRHPFLEHDGPIPFVHRGGALEAFENTIAAFEVALSVGFTYFETDVRATADGVLLSFHDATLSRVTDRDGRISELPWDEVAQARVGGREPIPRLDDLLYGFPGVRFNLDAKDASTLKPLADLLQRDRALLDRVCLASFSDRRLRWLRAALGDRVCTGLGPREIARLRLASFGARSRPAARRRPWPRRSPSARRRSPSSTSGSSLRRTPRGWSSTCGRWTNRRS